jgi:hypothetical protein
LLPDAATPLCKTPNIVKVTAVADTMLIGCNASNSYGSDAFANISAVLGSSAIFRFPVKDLIPAIQAKTVVSAVLTLTANPSCSACGGGLPAKAGTLEAHDMRVDWNEGVSGAKTGPDQCRRVFAAASQPLGWGAGLSAPSASTLISAPFDYDVHPNAGSFVDAAPSVDIQISLDDFSRSYANSGEVAFFVKAATGAIVVATRESTLDPPTLTFTICQP